MQRLNATLSGGDVYQTVTHEFPAPPEFAWNRLLNPVNAFGPWLRDLLSGNNTAGNGSSSDAVALFAIAEALEPSFRGLATSLTNYIRTVSNQYADGIIYTTQIHVHVRWGWIVFPIVVVSMSASFLAVSMWQDASARRWAVNGMRATPTPTQVMWKNNPLGLLVNGLDAETRRRMDLQSNAAVVPAASGTSTHEAEQIAKRTRVQLLSCGGVLSLSGNQ